MATIAALPEQSIIDGYKGIIDFYVCRGQPCVRRWPRYFTREPHPLEAFGQQQFGYINHLAPTLPEFIKDQYRRLAQGTKFTWKDLLVQAYMKGLYVSPKA